MAGWVTVRYLLAIRKLAEQNEDGELDLKTLREFCHDVVALRRGDHSGARLKMEQDRLEREREKTEEEVITHFERWAENQQVRDCLCQNWISPVERKRRLREIFGLPPEPPEPPTAGAPADDVSTPVNPAKPNPANASRIQLICQAARRRRPFNPLGECGKQRTVAKWRFIFAKWRCAAGALRSE